MGAEAKPLAVSPLDLIMKRIKIIGSQQNGREHLHEALALAASGKVRVFTETYRLDEIGKAYERVEKGQVRFRAVVTM
jgi:D-arabinose 1-dehydrogenase-like Zn-dependent alcohol dehydrogenase